MILYKSKLLSAFQSDVSYIELIVFTFLSILLGTMINKLTLSSKDSTR